MFFSCHCGLPVNGNDECEWRYLRPFVRQFNEARGKEYAFEECLDRVHRNRQEPEVLLRDSASGAELVIENRIVDWPQGYIGDHKKFHDEAQAHIEQSGEDRYYEVDKDLSTVVQIRNARHSALAGFRERYRELLGNAAGKFDRHSDALSVLVVYFVGDGAMILDEDIRDIASAVPLPDNLDEVWAGCKRWVSVDEYEVGWRRLA